MQILYIVIEEVSFVTVRITSSVHYWAEGVGRPGWKINRRDTLRELNEAAIGDEIQCVYSLKQLKKMSYKGPYSMKQVQEMRCTKGTSKSPQALPPVKHTSLPPFYCLPQTQLNKWHWIAYLSLIFFRSAEKNMFRR